MKTLLNMILLFTFAGLQSQTLNNKGLYTDENGDPYSGTLTVSENNLKQTFTVKEGRKEGPVQYFDKNGKLLETGSFSNGEKHDKWIRYDNAGKISAVAFYSLGKKSGTWLVYDPSGNKRFEMSYTEGRKTGIWTSWDENGKILDSKDYSQLD